MNYLKILIFSSLLAVNLMTLATEKPVDTQNSVLELRYGVESQAYFPQLSEFMITTQRQHTKLWFAGIGKKRELAGYALDAMEKNFDETAKYHPIFNKEVPLGSHLTKYLEKPLGDLRTSIDNKDGRFFKKSFDNLTSACNACHIAENLRFIVVQKPTFLPFDNQKF